MGAIRLTISLDDPSSFFPRQLTFFQRHSTIIKSQMMTNSLSVCLWMRIVHRMTRFMVCCILSCWHIQFRLRALHNFEMIFFVFDILKVEVFFPFFYIEFVNMHFNLVGSSFFLWKKREKKCVFQRQNKGWQNNYYTGIISFKVPRLSK